jgi:lipoprotein-releasing system permease protein
MSVVGLVAGRFLRGREKSGFLSFISFVSLFGVCLGVGALTVVMGVMEGFETTIRSVVTGTHSHMLLFSGKQLITDPASLEERVRSIGGSEVEAVSPYVFSQVMVAKGARVQGSMVEGVETSILRTTELEKHLMAGEMPKNGDGAILPTIILGVSLAEALGAKLGDTVAVISPVFERESLEPRARRFQVAGLLSTGMFEYDSKYSMITAFEARDFFRLPMGSASALKIKTSNAAASKVLAERLEAELGPPFRTKDWTEMNRNLLYAVQLQKAVIFVILTAIIIVAAFNIMSTLMMMMSEKRKEMSILKAMGLSPRSSARVFLRVGMVIGTAGATAGIALGLLICLVLARTKFISLPANVYFISFLPIDVRPLTLSVIALAALIVALLATLYPAWIVGRESPVEGLRYE